MLQLSSVSIHHGQEEEGERICKWHRRDPHADLQVLKPWCWYCEREFEDDKGEHELKLESENNPLTKVLLQHQKSKHFKCQLCPRKLNVSLVTRWS